jgi:hypothetical protein
MFTVDETKRFKRSPLLLIKQSSKNMEGHHSSSDDSSDSSDGSSDSSDDNFEILGWASQN